MSPTSKEERDFSYWVKVFFRELLYSVTLLLNWLADIWKGQTEVEAEAEPHLLETATGIINQIVEVTCTFVLPYL